MEYIILIIFLILMLIILKIVCKIDMKKITALGNNKTLNEKTNKYPSNIDICRKILKKLNNEKVVVQEDKEAKSCLYIVTTNKILIGNVKQSYTRIQTIAHECLHSVQDKKMLMFNFVYSNIYLLIFLVFAILTLFDILPFKLLFISIYLLMGFVLYFVRSFLETDAMIKAKFLAKEYMEEEKISSREEIDQIISEYDKLNNIGIKATNYRLLVGIIVKTIILTGLMLI